MIKLVFFIISLFIVGLIINQLVKCFSPKIREGATGSKDEDSGCSKKDPLQMAMENSANIKVIKEQMSKVTELTNKYDILEKQVESNSYNINKFNQQLADQKKKIPSKEDQDNAVRNSMGGTSSR